MDEMTRFEAQFEERLRAFARTGVQSVDSAEVARAVSVSHPKPAAPQPAARQLGGEDHRTRQPAVLGPWRIRSGSRTTFAAAAVVAMLALGVALFAVAGGPRPTPIEEPSPSLPGIVAPSSAPSGPSAAPTASPVTNPAGVWIATGTMGIPRYVDTALRLVDGRVLVLGGSSGDSDGTSAELYDPVTGTWSATGNMIRPIAFPPTLLRDGRVLAGDALDDGRPGAELYDPNTGTWSATGQMVRSADFVGDTATLLPDGKVLVTGMSAGDPLGSCEANGPVCRGGGAESYDPDSGKWTATGKMITPRYYASGTLLPDGRVLVAGGYVIPDVVTDVAELYDPSTGSWTAIASMPARLGHHTATLLRDGKVLVAGPSGGPQLEMAVYDPATGSWTALPVGPGYGTATLLADGRVLMAGGAFESVAAELYDPVTGNWTAAAPMLRPHGTQATLLLDGTVLVAGGSDCLDGVCVATASAELYVPAGVAPPPLPVFPTPPPPVIPTPTPRPTPLPPEAGPVPPNARPWTVTVVNDSAQRATLFLAEHFENGIAQLCGSVTPNVVPAGVTVDVIFQLPPTSVRGCWLIVNAIPGDEGGFFETSDAPMPGKVWVRADGEIGWLGP